MRRMLFAWTGFLVIALLAIPAYYAHAEQGTGTINLGDGQTAPIVIGGPGTTSPPSATPSPSPTPTPIASPSPVATPTPSPTATPTTYRTEWTVQPSIGNVSGTARAASSASAARSAAQAACREVGAANEAQCLAKLKAVSLSSLTGTGPNWAAYFIDLEFDAIHQRGTFVAIYARRVP